MKSGLREHPTKKECKMKHEHIQSNQDSFVEQRDSRYSVIMSQDDNLHLKRFRLVQSAHGK